MALTDYVIMPSADYVAACDKVRERTGKTDPIKSGDLAAEIEAIPSGGGDDEFPADRYFEGGIEAVDLPNATKIKKYAFYQDSKLKTISLPNVTSVGSYAFYGCSVLTEIKQLENLKSLSDYAFYNCAKLVLTELPDTLTSLGQCALSSCPNIKLTSLPSSIKTIGGAAFNTTGINIRSIPPLVTTISNSAFAYTQIEYLTIHSGITKVDTSAFRSITTLKSVLFEGSPSSGLWSGVFTDCKNLAYIYVPWAEGEKSGAPWGATNATIIYGYDPATPMIQFTVDGETFTARSGMTWHEFMCSEYSDGYGFTYNADSGCVYMGNRVFNDVQYTDVIIANHAYGDPPTTYTVTYNAPNCAFDPMPTTITEGGTFEVRAFTDDGYNFNTFQVYMGSFDVTETAVSNYGEEAQIRIEDVTGDVVITITTTDALVYGVTVNLDSHLTHLNYADSIASDEPDGYKDTYYLESGYVIATVDVTIGGVEHNEYFHVTTNGGYTEIPMSALTGDIVITLTTKGA